MAEPIAPRALAAGPAWPDGALNNTKSGNTLRSSTALLLSITLRAAVGVVAKGPNRTRKTKRKVNQKI